MLRADQVQITAENKEGYCRAFKLLVENRTTIVTVLGTRSLPFKVAGCCFELRKPEELDEAIKILKAMLDP